MSRYHKHTRHKRSRLRLRLRVTIYILAGLSVIILGILSYSASLEERDAFCASCHSQPETTYYDRTLAAQPVDLASFHRPKATKCIDCHSGPGVLGRLGALSIGAHDLFAWESGTAKQPAPLTIPIGDENCVKCHPDIENTSDFNQHYHAFLPRWQAIDPKAVSCVSCHSSHTTDGDSTIGYLQQQRTEVVCGNCHAVLSQ